MNPVIVEKEALKLIGKSIRVTTVNGENQVEIPKFWERSNKDGLVDRLCRLNQVEALAGLCLMEDVNSTNEFIYAIAVIANVSEAEANLEQMEYWEIPATTWAIFESIGPMPHAIQTVFHQIYAEWFPASDYEHAPAPELEVYPEGDTASADYRCEVWIPVRKKS